MTEDLRAKMDALRSVAPRINAVSDKARSVIDQCNDYLRNLGLGVPARGPCFRVGHYLEEVNAEVEGCDRRRVIKSHLVFDRGPNYDDGFTIHIAHVIHSLSSGVGSGVDELEEVDTTRETWGSASRVDRHKSFATLPALLEAIHHEATLFADRAEAEYEPIREMFLSSGILERNKEEKMDKERRRLA